MSVDLRTTLNAADAATGWTGDGTTPTVDTTAGFAYENGAAISTQHSNTDERASTTNVTGSPVNLSDATVYGLVKDNLLQTRTNGGLQIVLGDGTDLIGYGAGGNDDTGIQLDVFWNQYKFDTTTTAPYTNAYSGTVGGNNLAAVTEVGIGTVHLAKAQGNVDNIKIDRLCFHTNGSYGLRVNGGTIGTPETTADLAGDSITNGWGLVSNPTGKQYSFYAPTEFGNPTATADVYYEAIDEQWTLLGGAVGSTHFPFRLVGNATDTIDITFRNLVVVNVGTRSEWTVGDANVNTIDWDNVSFTDLGTMTFAAQSVTKTHDSITWNNCDQVSPNGCNGTDWTFNGAFNANGAMLLDTAGDCNNLNGVAFVQSGTHHAIIITATGTYDFTNFTFSGFSGTGTSAPVYNNSGGAVTINVTGGDTPTVRNGAGASTTVNATVPVKVTVQDSAGNAIQGAKVFLELVSDGTDVISYAVTDVNGEVSTTYGGTTPANVTGFARKGTSSPVYKSANINATIGSSGLDTIVTLIEDE